MRFTIPFLLAILVFSATVFGANATSFTPSDDIVFDIVAGADSIAFRLENGLGLPDRLALLLGGIALTIPALVAFHLFRLMFGGSAQAIHASLQSRRDEQGASVADLVGSSAPAASGDANEVETDEEADATGLIAEALNERQADRARPGTEDAHPGSRWSQALKKKPNWQALRQRTAGLRDNLRKAAPKSGAGSKSGSSEAG